MQCDYPGCGLAGEHGFIKGDEGDPKHRVVLVRCGGHAEETENMVRVASMRPAGLSARPTLRRISLEEAVVIGVMEK